MWRAWSGQAWTALMAAQSSVMLLDRRGPTRQNILERPHGESQVALTVQWGWPLLRVEPSIQMCCQSAGTRHRRVMETGGGEHISGKI